MRRYWLFIFCVLFLCKAEPIWAQSSENDFTDCGTPASSANAVSSNKVGSNGILCFDFDIGFGTAASDAFEVQSNRARLVLDQDRNSTGGAAIVVVQDCGVDPAADATCVNTSITLDGASPGGAITRGIYRFNVTTPPAGTQDAQIVIRGY